MSLQENTSAAEEGSSETQTVLPYSLLWSLGHVARLFKQSQKQTLLPLHLADFEAQEASMAREKDHEKLKTFYRDFLEIMTQQMPTPKLQAYVLALSAGEKPTYNLYGTQPQDLAKLDKWVSLYCITKAMESEAPSDTTTQTLSLLRHQFPTAYERGMQFYHTWVQENNSEPLRKRFVVQFKRLTSLANEKEMALRKELLLDRNTDPMMQKTLKKEQTNVPSEATNRYDKALRILGDIRDDELQLLALSLSLGVVSMEVTRATLERKQRLEPKFQEFAKMYIGHSTTDEDRKELASLLQKFLA